MINNVCLSVYAWAQSLRTNGIEALKAESGQDLIEYGVLAGFIGVALAAAFILAPIDVTTFAGTIANCVKIGSAAYTCP